jgi:hypothetical protein
MFLFLVPLLCKEDQNGWPEPDFDLSANNQALVHGISTAMGQVVKLDRQRVRNEIHRFTGRAGTNKKLNQWTRRGFNVKAYLHDRLYSASPAKAI